MTINVKRTNSVEVQLSGRCWYSIDELENLIKEAKKVGLTTKDRVLVYADPRTEFDSSLPKVTLTAYKDLNA